MTYMLTLKCIAAFNNTTVEQTVSIDDPSRIGVIIRAIAYKYQDYKCTLTNVATKRIVATAQYGRHYTLTNIYERGMA